MSSQAQPFYSFSFVSTAIVLLIRLCYGLVFPISFQWESKVNKLGDYPSLCSIKHCWKLSAAGAPEVREQKPFSHMYTYIYIYIIQFIHNGIRSGSPQLAILTPMQMFNGMMHGEIL